MPPRLAGFFLLLLPQLNYGVAWFQGSRRVADTLSHFAERMRRERVWDQAAFSELLLLPASPQRPWSGRHSVRVLDVLLYPNTCEQQLGRGSRHARPAACAGHGIHACREALHDMKVLTHPQLSRMFAGNLEYWLKASDFPAMRPVLLHFNCP